jgi:hypothetical protein
VPRRQSRLAVLPRAPLLNHRRRRRLRQRRPWRRRRLPSKTRACRAARTTARALDSRIAESGVHSPCK